MEQEFPTLTEYEEKVFAFFWKRYTPGFHFNSIQLEGDGRLPIVAAGLRLAKKGVVVKWGSCQWGLTDFGKKMAEQRQKQNNWKPK